jgi:uncharacterized damage-inducible protein DinB
MEPITATREQILSQYAAGPELVLKAIRGLSEEQLDLKLSAGSWSIRQLVHHITDGDYLWKEFLLQAMGEPEKEFSLEWYWCLSQDEWVKRWSYAERNVTHSVELFRANRQHTLELLQQVTDLWNKWLLIPTRHGGHEKASVGEVVAMQARHVIGHVEDIQKIRKAYEA